MSPQTQTVGWRLNVKVWLQSVLQHQRNFGVDLKSAASQNRGTFPRNFLIGLVAQLVRPLAVWLVKSALKDAASELNVTLDDETLDFLTEVAVTALMA